MSKHTPNPVAYTYGPRASGSTAHSIPHPSPISASTHHIAGILVTVFGLSELPPSTSNVACLWLLHPRLQTQECMAPFAAHLIREWNTHLSTKSKSKPAKGLIAVSFDARNHGTRLVSALSNEAWRSGNPHHAQDMYSGYVGTAADTSLLLDYLPGYIFPDNSRRITQNLVLGISLGGHAAWHCVMHDARISAAIVTIGCPDYVRLMSDRARLSRRQSWTETSGQEFLGSEDFPPSLVDAVRNSDPVGLLWAGSTQPPSDFESLMPLMRRCLGNKRILNLSGGADKLVPYAHSKPFVEWLQQSASKGGWFEKGGLVIEDVVFEGVGHDVPSTMVGEMRRFVTETLEADALNEAVAEADALKRFSSKI